MIFSSFLKLRNTCTHTLALMILENQSIFWKLTLLTNSKVYIFHNTNMLKIYLRKLVNYGVSLLVPTISGQKYLANDGSNYVNPTKHHNR